MVGEGRPSTILGAKEIVDARVKREQDADEFTPSRSASFATELGRPDMVPA
jgi:hypothetical protein